MNLSSRRPARLYLTSHNSSAAIFSCNAQVCGLQEPLKANEAHDGDGGTQPDLLTNLQVALEKFRDLGYLVVHRKVSPDKVGVPMTRNRLHFQGILKGAHEQEQAFLRDLAETWDVVCEASYEPIPLHCYLFEDGSAALREYLDASPDRSVTALEPKRGLRRTRSCQENREPEWKALHMKHFDQHQAGQIRLHSWLMFYAMDN